MNRWTIRAAVHGAVVGGLGVVVGFALVGVGAMWTDNTSGSDTSLLGVAALIVGSIVVLLSVIAGLTAANTQLAGLVRTTDDVLHDRAIDEAAAKEAAHARLGTLAAWSAISVAVGAVVSMIRGDGDSGIIAGIVRALLAGLVAAVWAVVTTLVLPVIVLENTGAVTSIKRSADIVRSTWGETVFGSVRIGARFALLFTLPGFLLLVGGPILGIVVGGAVLVLGAVLAVAGVVLMVIGVVKATTCRTVFGVALYRWATGEGALGPFSDEDLHGAVAVKGDRVPVG